MGAVHVLPGTTFSNAKVRGDYDAEGRAVFTLRELEAWLAMKCPNPPRIDRVSP